MRVECKVWWKVKEIAWEWANFILSMLFCRLTWNMHISCLFFNGNALKILWTISNVCNIFRQCRIFLSYTRTLLSASLLLPVREKMWENSENSLHSRKMYICRICVRKFSFSLYATLFSFVRSLLSLEYSKWSKTFFLCCVRKNIKWVNSVLVKISKHQVRCKIACRVCLNNFLDSFFVFISEFIFRR